jgi:glycosyltransferase involved in cell wall biosynthesis
MARILTLYEQARRRFVPTDMSYIRWSRMSAALADLGHQVDIGCREPGSFGLGERHRPVVMGPRLRRIPLEAVDCGAYDVVKTLFHKGFRTLEQLGGTGHPFVIAKLGSVVGRDDCEPVYFYGERRRHLFGVQERIAAHSRWVTVLTEASRQRWIGCFGGASPPTLLVPGAVDARIPVPGSTPFPRDGWRRCLFAGNIYDSKSQPEAHATLVAKLNDLGRRLARRSIRLYQMGPGDLSGLDPTHVRCLGPVPYGESWNLLHHADVGLVLALGPEPNENESSKIYHYLRAGLPTVCEAGFPNQELVEEARLGVVVANGDPEAMADAIEATLHRGWDRQEAIDFILARHTWHHRARIYDEQIRAAGL